MFFFFYRISLRKKPMPFYAHTALDKIAAHYADSRQTVSSQTELSEAKREKAKFTQELLSKLDHSLGRENVQKIFGNEAPELIDSIIDSDGSESSMVNEYTKKMDKVHECREALEKLKAFSEARENWHSTVEKDVDMSVHDAYVGKIRINYLIVESEGRIWRSLLAESPQIKDDPGPLEVILPPPPIVFAVAEILGFSKGTNIWEEDGISVNAKTGPDKAGPNLNWNVRVSKEGIIAAVITEPAKDLQHLK